MTTHDASSTTEAVHKIKQEIDRLTDLQGKALELATHVGMTPDEAKEYDERRKQIRKLVGQLSILEESQ